MAYSASNPLVCLVPRVGAGPAIWNYASTDAHTAVDETDYFTGCKTLGIKLGDVVFVHDTDAPTLTLHRVTAIDGDGNVTVGAATLA
jgi:hypothetical protein